MKLRFLFFVFALFMFGVADACAQMYSQKEAAYFATLYAVLNKKMQDPDIQSDLVELRKNDRFVKNLQKKLDRLTNDKNGNTKDRQIRKILEQAGKDIDNLL